MLAMATTGIWDVLNPELITVPTPDPNITHPICCLVLVKNRLWIGTGPFLAFMEMDSLFHEVITVPWIIKLWCVVHVGFLYAYMYGGALLWLCAIDFLLIYDFVLQMTLCVCVRVRAQRALVSLMEANGRLVCEVVFDCGKCYIFFAMYSRYSTSWDSTYTHTKLLFFLFCCIKWGWHDTWHYHSLLNQGCRYLDHHKKHPTNLVHADNVVIASVADGTLLYVLDASSTDLVCTIDMSSVALLVG